MNKLLVYIIAICYSTCMLACKDNSITDSFIPITNQNWTYAQPIKVNFEIKEIQKKYHIYINFRHTSEYKYANIWLRLIKIDPDKKKSIERVQFILANTDGAWLGNSSGSLFSYQLPLEQDYKFLKPGKYQFIIEQNMRDNPLTGISDVGLRIETNP